MHKCQFPLRGLFNDCLSTHDMCFSVLEKVLTYRKPKVQGVSYLCFLEAGSYENTEQIKSGCFPKRDQPNFSMLVLEINVLLTTLAAVAFPSYFAGQFKTS